MGEKFGIVDARGKLIESPTNTFVNLAAQDIAAVSPDGHKWFLLSDGAKLEIPCGQATVVRHLGDCLFAVARGETKYEVVYDLKKKEFWPDEISPTGNFTEGLLPFRNRKDAQGGYLDRTRNIVFVTGGLEFSSFNDGVASYRNETGGRNGIIVRKDMFLKELNYRFVGKFVNGRAAVQLADRSMHIIDPTGRKINKEPFERVWPYEQGRAITRKDDLNYGVVDADGEYLHQFKATEANIGDGRYVSTLLHGKCKVIDVKTWRAVGEIKATEITGVYNQRFWGEHGKVKTLYDVSGDKIFSVDSSEFYGLIWEDRVLEIGAALDGAELKRLFAKPSSKH